MKKCLYRSDVNGAGTCLQKVKSVTEDICIRIHACTSCCQGMDTDPVLNLL